MQYALDVEIINCNVAWNDQVWTSKRFGTKHKTNCHGKKVI